MGLVVLVSGCEAGKTFTVALANESEIDLDLSAEFFDADGESILKIDRTRVNALDTIETDKTFSTSTDEVKAKLTTEGDFYSDGERHTDKNTKVFEPRAHDDGMTVEVYIPKTTTTPALRVREKSPE